MPSFGEDLAAAVWAAWADVDALTTVVLATETGTTIDHTTGVITPVIVTETVPGLVSPFRLEEVDMVSITNRDRKVLIEKTVLQTPPGLQTKVTIAGEVWSMQSPPEPVANEGLWQLHVRRVGDV